MKTLPILIAALSWWAANAPLAFIDQVHPGITALSRHCHRRRRSGRIARRCRELHDALDQYAIANTFEIYSGTHTGDVAIRFQEHVMPFFSRTRRSNRPSDDAIPCPFRAVGRVTRPVRQGLGNRM